MAQIWAMENAVDIPKHVLVLLPEHLRHIAAVPSPRTQGGL
jgi:hypothetical protein